MEPFDAGLDDLVIPPADEPVRRRSVEEVVLAGTFPDEVPAVLGVDPDRAAAAAVAHMKRAGRGRARPSLAILDRVGIVARRRRHESDAVYASVLGVAKPFDLPPFAVGHPLERPADGCIGEWVGCVRRRDLGGNLDEIIRLQVLRRLREPHGSRRQPGATEEQDGDRENGGHTQATGLWHRRLETAGIFSTVHGGGNPPAGKRCGPQEKSSLGSTIETEGMGTMNLAPHSPTWRICSTISSLRFHGRIRM